jgi:hypothetical protein
LKWQKGLIASCIKHCGTFMGKYRFLQKESLPVPLAPGIILLQQTEKEGCLERKENKEKKI